MATKEKVAEILAGESNLMKAPEGQLIVPPDLPEPIEQRIVFKNEFDVSSMLNSAGQIELTEAQTNVLFAPIDEKSVQIRPDGMVYMPWVEYAKRLREVFSLRFAFIPQGMPRIYGNNIMWGFWFIVDGKLVGYAMGEQAYYPGNQRMTYGDAIEGAKSNARMRVCKDIGMFPELWQPDWIKGWRKKYAESYQGGGKTLWRKKNGKWEEDPKVEEMGDGTCYEGKLLDMGSPLHKAVEAMIGEEGWDRVLLHEYLMQQGKIDIVDGKPSFSTMAEEFAKKWLDNRKEFAKSFAAWLVKGEG